ncbi:phosphonate metabolism protein/1,5-bisphosphokinase (PRPP-forming) PhnN [Microbacterium sp. JZ31]|uniref:phosphonate metabolism protein/1,5-bisphosphokinase (PRPP-forming) PhnN n=1 Tax=Microbacterium sp. JZ31 TaxID=1906274 RepID=UPI001933092E|nr:phosphonate metabolism protein/1,5-bisphosphokinase (PRPP-forming) PhnN [Microbacterium sp. JZ31]
MSPDLQQRTGAFVAVVGPSGAGKDAVIAYARERLEPHGVVFARRVITRPAGPAEECASATEEQFAQLQDGGSFALAWRAHGLAYGIPAEYARRAENGEVVVANVSRSVLSELPDRFPRAFAVRITVPEDVRRARIAARGREDDAGVAARVSRPDPAPDHPVDLEIVNDGTLEQAGERLVTFLRGVVDS